MITISDKWQCVGCAACKDVCPSRCISMEVDEEGFWYPKINENLCVNCHKCEKVCPVHNDVIKYSRESVWYAAFHKKTEVRLESSSGAAFYEFARVVLSRGGVVWGAAFDECMNLRHIAIETVNELPKLMKSKYVQSSLEGVFLQTREYLKNGFQVLFSGTPCHIKALKLFLGKKYDNLVTVEVVCHGVPSPGVFHSYCKECGIKDIDFRRKERGWYDYDVCITTQKNKKKTYRASKDLFMQGFLKNLYLRPSCSRCQAKSFRSGADITLGDFWGIEQIKPEMYDNKGVSLIGLHTDKAKKIWDEISQQFVFLRVNEEDVLKPDSVMLISCKAHPDRTDFFKIYTRNGVMKALKYFKNPFSISEYIKMKKNNLKCLIFEFLIATRSRIFHFLRK